MTQMGMDMEDCNTGLGLGMSIGLGMNLMREDLHSHRHHVNGPPVQLDLLPLAPVLPTRDLPWGKTSPGTDGERSAGESKGTVPRRIDVNKLPASCYYNEDTGAINVSSPNSALSSFHVDSGGAINAESSCYGMSVKRERDATEELEAERACSRVSDEEADQEGGTRKKLRLSKEQSALLEESFKENSSLNPKQKQALAKRLNLRPRQVEVWFQNRRARTKLKQTEVDCEFLKRCCESLTDENRRLQKELQELRALKLASPLYMQMPAATLTMCPSCERVVPAENSRPPPFTLAKPQFYSYTHSSAAC